MLPSPLMTLLAAAAVGLLAALAGSEAAEDIRYTVAETPWPQELGHHRLRLRVAEAADAVWAHLPWRRRDPQPETRGLVVADSAGRVIADVARVAVTREAGDIVFQAPAAGGYDVYYLPYTADALPWAYAVHYAPSDTAADAAWLERNGLTADRLAEGRWRSLPQAEVLECQARTSFHRFDPLEVVATAEEVGALLAQHPGAPYLVFPEDRGRPIRMTDDLPVCWVEEGPREEFRGEAQQGEYYVFQIGLYAAREPVNGLSLAFSPLKDAAGHVTPAGNLTCLNLTGTDWLGRPIERPFTLAQGKVGALWCGVDVPSDLPPGRYEGTVTVAPAGAPEAAVGLTLEVREGVLEDRGDSDLPRLSRLRWLNSTIGLDDEVVVPFAPLKVRGPVIECLDRSVRLGADGLPASIRSNGHEVLAAPARFVVEGGEGPVDWKLGRRRTTRPGPAAAAWEVKATAEGLTSTCRAKMEADGYVAFDIALCADGEVALSDTRLEIPFRREVATYMMGMGKKGGYRPKEWQWMWDAGRANNAVWIGDVEAGLHCKLKNPEDTWDIYNLTAGVPKTWGNDGQGGCTITEEGDTVVLRAYTGPRTMQAGEELRFRFGLLITPVKPLDPAHFSQRYYHDYVPPETAVANGANIVNIHHGNELNPNINYPFLQAERLAEYVRRAHEQGVKVKIYYTVRELSNYVAEMWCLRSLGHEVFAPGGGGGAAWLQEHLVSDYAPAWHHVYPDGEVDAAIVTTGLSRWHNYYLEGLSWLIRNVEIDGLYLDGIGYDREIMKRVRKVMDRARPGCLIDFHSGNEFPFSDLRVSPACKYMEHFPYLSSLWFGEGYDYNETPDYWLVEVSGLPFGLYGEMLQDNGNPWRGMIYGMSARYYSGADPKHLWKLWDDFGIAEAKMLGYWSPKCPVKTDDPGILATAYRRPGRTLVSVASWAKEAARCRLEIDWPALGLDPTRASLYAPPVQGFQSEAVFGPEDAIPVMPGRGWLLILSEERHEVPPPVDEHAGRKLLLAEDFAGDRLGPDWTVSLSSQPGTSLRVSDSAMQIETCANCCAFAERPLPPGVALVEARVYTGTDGGASWGPGLALVWPDRCLRLNVRAEGRFGVDDGANQLFGGFSKPGSWYHLRLRIGPDALVAEVSGDDLLWETIASLPRDRFLGDPVAVRLGKMSPGARNEDFTVLGPSGACQVKEFRAFSGK